MKCCHLIQILVWDDVAKNNVKSILGKCANYQERNFIRNQLSRYKVDGRNILLDLKIDIDDITISISDIDFYRKYLGQINLLKSN